MSQFFSIHKTSPQPRLIREAVKIINAGGVIAYPTDSSYALGCEIGNKEAMQRIRKIRRLDDTRNFTLICKDLSELSLYAKIDNATYRLLKRFTPGPYTTAKPETENHWSTGPRRCRGLGTAWAFAGAADEFNVDLAR